MAKITIKERVRPLLEAGWKPWRIGQKLVLSQQQVYTAIASIRYPGERAAYQRQYDAKRYQTDEYRAYMRERMRERLKDPVERAKNLERVRAYRARKREEKLRKKRRKAA